MRKVKPNIGLERIEYTLKNGATVEIIREKVLDDEYVYAAEEDLIKEL